MAAAVALARARIAALAGHPTSGSRSPRRAGTRADLRGMSSPLAITAPGAVAHLAHEVMLAMTCRSSQRSVERRDAPTPSSAANCRWRSSIASSTPPARPPAQRTGVFQAIVMPLTAEEHQHARVLPAALTHHLAMLRQFASDETLVPPNLSTIHSAQALRSSVSAASKMEIQQTGSADCAALRKLFVVEEFAQVFFELAIGKHLFELAPAPPFLPWERTRLVDARQQPVVVGAVFGLGDEFFVISKFSLSRSDMAL